MIRTIAFSLVSLFFSGTLDAQPAFQAQGKITYEARHTIFQPIYNGTVTLYFDNRHGYFVHEDFPTESSYEERGTTVIFTKGDSEGLAVFMDLNADTLAYKSTYRAVRETWIFSDSLPRIDWTITQETKPIASFTGVKAVGDFGGRTYEVWFTYDVPVRLGPYKLWGLPGLILEARSEDGRVDFQFASLTYPLAEAVPISPPSDGRFWRMPDFEDWVVKQQMKRILKSKPPFLNIDRDPDPNWEIEKDYWTIIQRFKQTDTFRKLVDSKF